MLNESDLAEDQNLAIDRLYEHNETLMVANMGAGKTVITLTAISELLAAGVVKRVLVVAPVKVCQTVWATEAKIWGHLQHLTVADASGGNVKNRIAALNSAAPIVCINFENLAWLFREYKAKGVFDGMVVDELTKLKNSGGTAFKALRPRLVDFTWRLGMTGTPVSENWEGLFGQMLIVDGGERLGTRKDSFLRRYFYATDYKEYNWELYDWAAETISAKIKDVVYTVPDYRHELPELLDEIIPFHMPSDLVKKYDELKKSMLLEMPDGGVLTADSAAVLSGKLSQCSSGFLYSPPSPEGKRGDPVFFSDYKITACEFSVSRRLDKGESVVIAYWFDADRQRLNELYPNCELSPENIDKWNRGELDVLLIHPKSAGHGLNLAAGGHNMIWLGPVWSRDMREQTIARLWRRGQKYPVHVITFVGEKSIDELMVERVEGKKDYEVLFKQHLGA
jgi:hypothetical protein